MRLALPATVWVLAVFAIPTALLLASSVLTYDGADVTGPLTTANYRDLFGNGYFRTVLWDTVWMSVTVGAVCTAAGLLVAHFVVRSGSRWRTAVLLVVVSPLVSSVVVRTYGWLVLLQDDGLVNTILVETGLTGSAVPLIGSEFAVVLGLVHVLLPFAVFTAMSSLQGVDPVLERASRDLGAGPVTTFRRITLPLILPGLIAGFMLTFAISLGAYAAAAVLGGGRVQTLATLVRDRMVVSLEWGQAAAISVVILAVGTVTVSLLLFAGRRARKGAS
ncbi:ABC transporter permease [Actinophytocola algeriensis]|uniref:Putative spermidine/putrescine transport system permease protein n=1 Tax=Actinophytocola algeriensis TaxID=1768010 RepID=A0A7W7VHK2_9PSEU|nr:ABC transporter permease [Actinophytocola algeriensis]MBB4910513.1 putative spermidine/putrescine transport system permease protein [Actinophytocola algeriensis]MBE1480498.1 putative spermidine/putrescine transport system permease protein [Actinophytocola algeriensis]